MDSIVKIVLAIKLKFLLIILSIGTSYFVEQRVKKQVDPVSAIEIISPDSSLSGSGHPDVRSLFKVAKDNQNTRLESSDHIDIQSANYVTDRPFGSRGLEIYIEL
jgi:hypothetical protein